MKNILVLTDFTSASRSATEYAASLGQLFTAKVHLLHIYIEPTPVTEVPSAWIITDDSLQKEKEALINKAAQSLTNTYAIDVDGEVIMGYKGDAIIDKAKEMDAGLIVMGMKVERNKILGSTTLTVIRRSKKPVLVVPEGFIFRPVKNIVFASDFTEVQDSTCLDALFEMIEQFHAGLQLLHVNKEKAMAASEVPGRIQLGRLFSKVPLYSYEEIENEDVEKAIDTYIQNNPSDLLVMVAHRHNIFERLFGMVHTRSMSYKTKLPLLILEDK